MRKFGSVAYVHQDQGKLKPRALKGIFLGYPTGTNGYKVWLLDEEKCVVSRNVIFHEDVMFKMLKDPQTSSFESIEQHIDEELSQITNVKVKEKDKSEQGGVIIVTDSESESDNENEEISENVISSHENQDQPDLANY